jgi:hypothetical protein
VVLAVVLLGVAWAGFTVWRAADDLHEVQRDALVLRQKLVDGDADGARTALAAYQESAAHAHDSTDGFTFGLFEHLPVLGDDARAVALAAKVLDDLGEDGLPPIVESAEQVTGGSFRPRDHQFPLERIAAIREPAKQSEAAFDAAADDLRGTDTDGLLGPVAARFDELRSLVLTSRDTLGSAYRAAAMMPDLLGQDGPRRYLLVFENNAELRSTGGLAGSVSVLVADHGHVEIVDQEATHSFGITRRSPVPLTTEEKDVFGPALGQYFLDASLTPDVPRAAELMAAHWDRAYHQRLDGIFLVDPVAVSYLLTGTGPVDVPGFAPVSSLTVVSSVENEIYKQTTDFAAHDTYQNAVAKAVFNAFADGRGDPAQVITGLVQAVAEGRIRMHSFDGDVQDRIAGTAIAGELPQDEPAVGVYLNDGTGSKMSYYLEYDVTVVARSCAGDVQDLTGAIRLTNDTPDDIADYPWSVTGFTAARPDDFVPGEQQVAIYLMLPGGGRLEELEVADRQIPSPTTMPFEHREVAPVYVDLEPGETQTVDFVARTDAGQTGDVDLFVTPGATPGSASQTVPSACSSQ